MSKTGTSKFSRLIRDVPIQKKLFFSFLVLIILPAFLIGYLSFYRSSELLKHKTEQYTNDILLETGNNIEVKLREVERLSFQIVSNNAIHDALKNSNTGFTREQDKINAERAIDSQLRSLISSVSGIAAIQVISNSNISYYINPASLSLTALNLKASDRKTLNEGEGSIFWFDTDPSIQTIAVGRTINSYVNQDQIGYAMIYLRESSVINVFRGTELFNNGELYVINNQGNIISYKDKGMLGKRNEFTSLNHLNQVSAGDFVTTKINGRNYYLTYRFLQGTSWRLISFIPAVEYEREIVWLRNWILLIILASCILSVAFSIAISRGISKPVMDLSNMMIKIGDGDFNVYSSYESKDEIGVLSCHFNNMVGQVKRLIRKAYQEELLKQKAELKSLHMQINPHFLYNSLESINWMARIRGIPEIGKMVKALGDLMRESISGDDFITVDKEIKNVNNYLTIQKFRYGDKIKVMIDIDPQIKKFEIPKLILQPIVENAIVHGIENKLGDGHIEIMGTLSDNMVTLQVVDDGVGFREDIVSSVLSDHKFVGQSERHTHIGLQNVDRRIRMYYGDEYGIIIKSRSNHGTTVNLHFPTHGKMHLFP